MAIIVVVLVIVLVMFVVFFVVLIIAPVVAPVRIVVATLHMLCAVVRCVFIGVPAILDKIHLLAACVVSAAVLRPMLCVARWNAQINRLPFDIAHRTLDHHGLRVDDARLRQIANIDTAVKTRLTDIDRYADIARHCR